MRRADFLFLVILPVLYGMAFPARGAIITIQAGKRDGFAAPVDIVSPSTVLVQAYRARHGQSAIPFDAFVKNRAVLHTFTGLPENIVDATIEFRARAMGASYPYNDTFYLGFVKSSTGFTSGRAWERGYAAIKGDLGLGARSWGYREDRTFVLSLSALPTSPSTSISIIPQLNQNRFLDIASFDDTALDYVKLTLYTADTQQAVPETSSGIVWSILAIAVCLGTRRRCRLEKPNPRPGPRGPLLASSCRCIILVRIERSNLGAGNGLHSTTALGV